MIQRHFLMMLFLVHLSSGSEWPAERFGLPMSSYGCPVGPFRQSLIQQQDNGTEMSKNFNLFTSIKTKTIEYHFCMKYNNFGKGSFPQGQYCVYMYLDLQRNLSCPRGMKQGYIHWKGSVGPKKGVLPAGMYMKTMRIYYCCRVNGDKTQPIQFPTEKPFFLLAYNSSLCQTVKWMEAWVEFLQYQRQAFIEKNFVAGAHPFLGPSYQLYYCFYKGCQRKEGQIKGVIETGYKNFPSQNRYCSWIITPKPSSKVSLTFTSFHFTGQASLNYVSVYDGDGSHGKLLGLFNAVKSPLKHRLITNSSSMFVLLRCFTKFKENCRFKALYTSYHSSVEPTSIPQSWTTKLSLTSPEGRPTTVPANRTLSSSSRPREVKKNNKTVISAVLGTIVPISFVLLVAGFIICKKRRAKLRREYRNESRATEGDNFDASMESLLLDPNGSMEEISFVVNHNAALRLYTDSEGSSSSGHHGVDAYAQKLRSNDGEYVSLVRTQETGTTGHPRYTEDLGETDASQRSKNDATQLQESIREAAAEREDEESDEQIDLKRLDESRILGKPRSKSSDTCDV